MGLGTYNYDNGQRQNVGASVTYAASSHDFKAGYQYMQQAPWLSFAPGAAIFVTVLAFNLLGDGLRRGLDPRLWQRGES